MRYKISRRLAKYFLIVLSIMSVLVSVFYLTINRQHISKIREDEIKTRAQAIALTLSSFGNAPLGQHGQGMQHDSGMAHGGGMGMYLKFIDDIAQGEVWLVDENMDILSTVHMQSSLSYNALPSTANSVIKDVFAGKTNVSTAFSSALQTPSVTAGAPVMDENGKVFAVVLLHSPIDGIERAQSDSIFVFVCCISAALLLSVILSVVLAKRFALPIEKMCVTTRQITEGDYNAQTGVRQNDEIGELAENIDKLSHKLVKVRAEREILDKQRRDFMSSVSHELRTPVTVMKGSIEVLRDGLVTDKEQVREYYEAMFIDAEHLERLVNDLLELTRLQNSDFVIEKANFNLADAFDDAVRVMRAAAKAKQIALDGENTLGAYEVLGDYGRLRQMFIIILDNAIKFTQNGGEVKAKMFMENNECKISISDTGSGIRPEEIPFIFEKFYHINDESNKNGTGLGLSIAKQIAQRHAANIICESTSAGTVFTVIFLGQ